jgi:hypothetical protein
VRVAAGMFEVRFSRRRSPRVVISRERYVVITENGVKFARECYCSSASLPGIQIELYGFLLTLLSFGGVLPLVAVRRWRRTKILRKASDNKFAVVTGNIRVLPKKVVEEAMKEIWGECPKSIYV